MTEQKKLPSKVEENIQNLAGDIYLQIEDKITALLTSYHEELEVSPELIEQQPAFQQLSQENQQLKSSIEKINNTQNSEIKALVATNEKLTEQIGLQAQEIENHTKLSNVKLTDTEKVLKENLHENSILNEQVKKLSVEVNENNQALSESQEHVKALSTELSQAMASHDALSKNDKAKTATISIQNQQISDLQLKHDQVAGELEYLKAEQEQVLRSNNELLTNEQQQAADISKQKQALESELVIQNRQITQLQNDNKAQVDEIKLLQKEKSEQVQTVVKLTEKYRQLSDKDERQHEKNEKYQKDNKDLKSTIGKNNQQMHDDESQISALQKELKTLENTIIKHHEKEQELRQQQASLAEQVNQQMTEKQELVLNKQQLKAQQQQEIENLQANHQQVLDKHASSITEKNAALSQLQKYLDSSEKSFEIKISQQGEEISAQEQVIKQAQTSHQELSVQNDKMANALNDFEQQVSQLEQSLQTEKSTVLNNRKMVQESKSKQELEYNKARETIKYLRDENTELNRKLAQQVSELEDKLTEYRLRFEYAQKQLTKLAK
jgi:chromosome segregation ATPase